MVTNLRNGTSKAGNPYGIFTLEDYVGAFEFALFGNNYVEFGKYMIKDLYLYITAIVQEKGADYRFKKPVDPNSPQELELKIQKIELFRDVKDKLVDKITLTIPLQQIDDEFADELSSLLLAKKGNVNVYVHVIDENSPNKVKLFSRQHRIKIDTDVYRYIKKAKEASILDFAINE